MTTYTATWTPIPHSHISLSPPPPTCDMDIRFLWSNECHEFARYGILVTPRAAMPPHYEISAGGVPIPPVPVREDLVAEIEERRRRLPE